MKDHPLFPNKPEADIETIHVLRFENGRKCYAAQRFRSEELTEVGHVYERFGGGQYELEARGPTKGGTHGIVARQEYQIAGHPRVLNPELPGQATAAPAAPAGPPALTVADPLMAFMMQMSRDAAEDRRAMMGMITQIATRPAPASAPADSGMSTVLAAMIASNGEIVKALVGGRQSAAPEKDPVDRVLEIFQAGAELREGMAQSLTDRAQAGELDLAKLADGAEKVIKVVRQAKDLADAGAGPDAAAAAAAAAAE